MSNIPAAREMLQRALVGHVTEQGYRDAIIFALKHLDRKKPEFIAPKSTKPLTQFNKRYARSLRETGMGVRTIASTLGSCIASVHRALEETA